MTLAQASVGAAATSPAIGTIFNAADPTRHGAATNPQPPNVKAQTAKIATRRSHMA